MDFMEDVNVVNVERYSGHYANNYIGNVEMQVIEWIKDKENFPQNLKKKRAEPVEIGKKPTKLSKNSLNQRKCYEMAGKCSLSDIIGRSFDNFLYSALSSKLDC
jgi:hypothetical protein